MAMMAQLLSSPKIGELYGRIVLDDSVIALNPRNLGRENRLRGRQGFPDTFVFWGPNHYQGGEIAALLASHRFAHSFRLIGTKILIFTQFDLMRDALLGGFVESMVTQRPGFPNSLGAASWTGRPAQNLELAREGRDVFAVRGTGPLFSSIGNRRSKWRHSQRKEQAMISVPFAVRPNSSAWACLK
jgi:hypothetical protein